MIKSAELSVPMHTRSWLASARHRRASLRHAILVEGVSTGPRGTLDLFSFVLVLCTRRGSCLQCSLRYATACANAHHLRVFAPDYVSRAHSLYYFEGSQGVLPNRSLSAFRLCRASTCERCRSSRGEKRPRQVDGEPQTHSLPELYDTVFGRAPSTAAAFSPRPVADRCYQPLQEQVIDLSSSRCSPFARRQLRE